MQHVEVAGNFLWHLQPARYKIRADLSPQGSREEFQWGLRSHIGLRPAPAVIRAGELTYQAAQKGHGIYQRSANKS
ncbi:hypothetical protein TREES_T100014317 [Tupaia chinensis]|uniref:Uncharacterized protein n=1 Tax=Tupaia chinensis TaxID=246437 RepID=L9JEU0_TUPCH|nr:hypothetical protein TREES_T100014317 [Tupaia chinensis]